MKYKNALAAQGLVIHSVDGDGNCLFRSVSHQVYGTDMHHDLVRSKCMDYMEVNAAFFSQFVVGGMDCFHLYLEAKRTPGCWGDGMLCCLTKCCL
jgi:OTU domain-containing protein 5